MRRFIFLLLIFIFSVYLGIKIAEDPGYLLLSYKNISVEMPLWFALLSLVFIFCAGYFLIQLFNDIDFSLYRFKKWLQWRQKNKAFSKTNRGLVELLEGDWKNAEYYLISGVSQSDSPLVNYLAAAKAAHEQQLFDKRDAYLRKAYDCAPQAELAIGLTQAQFQMEQGKNEQALATLAHVKSLAPKHKFVLKLLERMYVRLGEWRELLQLLPQLKKMRVIEPSCYLSFEAHLYEQLFLDPKYADVESIQMYWENLPSKFQIHPSVLSSYVKRLLAEKLSITSLESTLLKAIKKNWHQELVRLYGLLHSEDTVKQLTKTEAWLAQHASDATLYLTLGRLSAQCQLWGKAKDYFKMHIKLLPTTEGYLAYADLLEALNEKEEAKKFYRLGAVKNNVKNG